MYTFIYQLQLDEFMGMNILCYIDIYIINEDEDHGY